MLDSLSQLAPLLIAATALGLTAGLIAGLLGVGGGLLIVPALALIYTHLDPPIAPQHIMPLALGTSLACIIITALASIRAHQSHQNIHWPSVKRLTPAIATGALLGAVLADRLPANTLRYAFASFEILVAVHMLQARPQTQPQPQKNTANPKPIIGLLFGSASGLLGIGGGTLSVPYLHACTIPMRQAIGSAAALGLPIAIAGATGYILAGLQQTQLPAHSLGYIHLPSLLLISTSTILTAPLGAALTQRLNPQSLKRLFALLLLILASKLLLSG